MSLTALNVNIISFPSTFVEIAEISFDRHADFVTVPGKKDIRSEWNLDKRERRGRRRDFLHVRHTDKPRTVLQNGGGASTPRRPE